MGLNVWLCSLTLSPSTRLQQRLQTVWKSIPPIQRFSAIWQRAHSNCGYAPLVCTGALAAVIAATKAGAKKVDLCALGDKFIEEWGQSSSKACALQLLLWKDLAMSLGETRIRRGQNRILNFQLNDSQYSGRLQRTSKGKSLRKELPSLPASLLTSKPLTRHDLDWDAYCLNPCCYYHTDHRVWRRRRTI